MKNLKFMCVFAAVAAVSLSACSAFPFSGGGSAADGAGAGESSVSEGSGAAAGSAGSDSAEASDASSEGEAGAWPEAFHTEFLAACSANAGANEEFCQCTYDAAQAKYTLDEFTSMTLAASEGDSESMGKVAELAQQCMDKL